MEEGMKIFVYSLLFGLMVNAMGMNASAENAEKNKVSQPVAQPPAAPGFQGTVIETMNSGGYTYVRVDTKKEKIWAAAPETQVKVGDTVAIPPGMIMRNHQSKTLNRTFDEIYFVSDIGVPGKKLPDEKPSSDASDVVHGKNLATAPADMSFKGITKPEGGKTINEIYTQKETLTGKDVVLRGKVVKFSPNIMDKNWMHVQDGTGEKGTNDLTITTAAEAKVGDTVLIKGALATNKDFGLGYKYDIIIENAQVTVE